MTEKRIRILFVHHFSNMGGATMSLFYLIEKVDPKLFDAEVLFLGGEGPAVDFFRSRGIKIHLLEGISIYPHAYGAYMSFISRKPFVPFQRFFQIRSSVQKLLFFFQEHPFDLVHVNTSLLLAVGKAAKLSGAKVVWHVRESLHPGIVGLRRRIIRSWIKRYSDWIIAISSFEKNALGKTDKISVVYNYVDFKRFDKTQSGSLIRRKYDIDTNAFVVTNLGGAVHSKGADVFVKAASILCEKYENMRFLLVGIVNKSQTGKWSVKAAIKRLIGMKHDLSSEILQLITNKKLEKKVVLTGVRTDIPEILAASDVLAWTATVPHFARPIIEAAAMAKPVVAADFPNTKESMDPNVTGLLFTPRDAKDLARNIEKLFLNKNLGTQLGEEGYTLASRKFNADINFAKIKDVYLKLMSSDV